MISSIEAHSDTNHYMQCLWSPYGLFQTNNLHVPAYTLTHLSTKLSDVLRTQVYCRGAKIFYDDILEKARVNLDYTKLTETKERCPVLRNRLYLSLDVLFLLQCTFS